MTCVIALLSLFAPRLAIVLVWLFSDYLGRAYETTLWPVLGFFFMPLTTLTYAWAMHSNAGSVSGIHLVVVVLAVLADLGLIGGSSRASRRSRRSG